MIDNLARPGGQLLGLYFLTLVAMGLSLIDHATGTKMLDTLIGAILMHMQAGGTKPNA